MFLSLPKDWSYSVSGLAAISKEGKDGILSGLKELEAAGYLERHRYRNERGRLGDSEYVIYEIPRHVRPVPATPEQGLPKLEKPTLEKPVLDYPVQDIPVWEKPKFLTASTKRLMELCRNYEVDYPFPRYNGLF